MTLPFTLFLAFQVYCDMTLVIKVVQCVTVRGKRDCSAGTTSSSRRNSIGDLAVAAMPFEVFAEIGLEFKRRILSQPLMNISIANGSHGYLPTPKQHRLGGYETWIGVNHVRLNASAKMVNALVEMLGELKLEQR